MSIIVSVNNSRNTYLELIKYPGKIFTLLKFLICGNFRPSLLYTASFVEKVRFS